MLRQYWPYLCLLALSSVLPPDSIAQQIQIPNAILEISVRQKEDGKVGKGIHLLKLSCWDGNCSMTSLSLNQCGDSSDGQAFYPRIERRSTAEGNLEVRSDSNVLVVKETGFDIGGDFVTTLRFGFERPAPGEPAMKVTSFTGGYVKNSQILKKVLNIEYVPLPREMQVVRLDCAVLLPGLAAK